MSCVEKREDEKVSDLFLETKSHNSRNHLQLRSVKGEGIFMREKLKAQRKQRRHEAQRGAHERALQAQAPSATVIQNVNDKEKKERPYDTIETATRNNKISAASSRAFGWQFEL